jgi:polyisoprenoid-binding protein YceI
VARLSGALTPDCYVAIMVDSGKYSLGPKDGKLLVKVERDGMAKKMGHDLTLEVGDWSAEVTVDDDPDKSELTLTAKPSSMKVVEAKGGAKPLSDGDKSDIKKNIDTKILSGGQDITFKSKSVSLNGGKANVSGDLTIQGKTQPAQVQLNITDTKVTGRTSLTQSKFGIKPFSAMMGALKVKDNVEIEFEADLPK